MTTSNPYHPDPVLNWLASQFAEGLVDPCKKAKAAFDEIVRAREMASKRENITQPEDWWEAFKAQAKADGQTLSAWLGDCGKANLPKEVAAGLSERPPANRPKKSKDQ